MCAYSNKIKSSCSYVHVFELREDDELSCLEAVKLAVAADFLLLKPYGFVENHCLSVIEKKIRPRHVWGLLDGVFSPILSDPIQEICISVSIYSYNFYTLY